MSNTIQYKVNFDRINFLLNQYNISETEFLKCIYPKKDISFKDLKNMQVKVATLEKIDEIFNKGVTWYIDETPLPNARKNNVLSFRNSKNKSEKRNIADISAITKFENKKIDIGILSRNIQFEIKRELKNYISKKDIKKDVKKVAFEIHEKCKEIMQSLGLKTPKNDKQYLENLCKIMEELGVFVFENAYTWDKKIKTAFEGFYLGNIIVINIHENIRREIFTLLHEFAHHLLDKKEIDSNVETCIDDTVSNTERWCNNFAFYFLLNTQVEEYEKIKICNKKNDFNRDIVSHIVSNTYLNPMAIYTNLRMHKKISRDNYKKEVPKLFSEPVVSQKKNFDKTVSIKESKRKPIQSQLYETIVHRNFSDGHINEVELCNYLDFPEKKKQEFLESVYT